MSEGVGSAAGVATVGAVSEATKESVGSITGVATVSAVGLLGQAAVGSAAGSSTTAGIGLVEYEVVASAAGVAVVSGVGESVTEAVGSAAGSSTAQAVRAMLIEAVGVSLGLGTASARAPTVQQELLDDLASRRGLVTGGFDSARYLELSGATIIEPTAFEPDPSTYRGTHYYNAVTNTLYKKIVTRKQPGIVVAHWQKVSD
jgi:hypothetical protein